ncbi:MAG TPA: hypothetical protein VIJ11_02915, partial [Galbitalea sp.]
MTLKASCKIHTPHDHSAVIADVHASVAAALAVSPNQFSGFMSMARANVRALPTAQVFVAGRERGIG